MRRAAHVAAVVMAALSAVACAPAGGGEGVATLGGSDEQALASPSPSVDPEEALDDFSECMREEGVEVETAFEGGDVGIRIEANGEVPPDTIQEADAACRHLLPEGLIEPPSAEERAQMYDNALRFAECMREHGLDWPDPEMTENGGLMFGPGEGFDFNDPRVREAELECRPHIEQGPAGEVREVGP